MAIGYWLKNPTMLFPRIRYWVWERLNPDKPWMCPGTIRFCETRLKPDMRGIEFGSGRSTAWFAGKLGHLISIEHHAEWYAQVRGKLQAAGVSNVDYRHVPLNHPQSEGEQETYAATPDYVAAADALEDNSIHFAVVDGHYRSHCIRHLLPKIAPGGYLLVDDCNIWSSFDRIPVPADWPIVDDSSNGVKRCVIWQKPANA